MYWISRYLDLVTLTYISCSNDFDTFYVDIQYLLNYKANNHNTLYSAHLDVLTAGTLIRWPWPVFHAPVTWTHFTSTFDISSTIRPTTTKPCIVLLLDVLTRWISWAGDFDLYFALQWLCHILHQHSISPQLLDLHPPNLALCFTSMYWIGRYLDLVTLTCISRSSVFVTFYDNIRYLLNFKAYNHHTLHSALLNVLTWLVFWPGDLDLYFKLQWLLHILRRHSIIIELYNTKSQCSLLCWRYSH